MRAPILVSMSILIAAASGCKKSQKDKCEAVYRQMMQLVEEMAKQFGSDESDRPTAEDKKKFMATCEKLPAEAVDCMSFEKMGDEKCAAILEKAEAEQAANAEPVPLEWETVTLEDGRITARVPKGWKHEDFMGDRYTPPEEADLGFFTSFEIGTSCGGTCEPLPAAEWVKRIDESVITPLTGNEDTEITSDEKLGDSGRLIRSRTSIGKPLEQVTAVFWKDGGSDYVTCRAELDRRLAGNVADFERACRELKIE